MSFNDMHMFMCVCSEAADVALDIEESVKLALRLLTKIVPVKCVSGNNEIWITSDSTGKGNGAQSVPDLSESDLDLWVTLSPPSPPSPPFRQRARTTGRPVVKVDPSYVGQGRFSRSSLARAQKLRGGDLEVKLVDEEDLPDSRRQQHVSEGN